MQTFLPVNRLDLCPIYLDDKRLGKQRVETKQILIALGIDVGDSKGDTSSGWRHHPAVKMWKGCEYALSYYGFCTCREWVGRGFRDVLAPQFELVMRGFDPEGCHFPPHSDVYKLPSWWGVFELHSSHRSNLVRKDAAFYSQWFLEDGSQPYYWPTQKVGAA